MQVGDTWKEWTVEQFIGEGSFGKVYKIIREEFGQTYESALKVIRVPQNRSEVDSMRSEGMSEASVTDYYRSVVEDIVSEFALMSRLRGNSNIVSYEDHQVVELEDEFGWEIYIRMELLTPLLVWLKDHELTRDDVVRLGVDMCKALETCQKNNIIHRDVKPENIFYSDQGTFKLGDFGIARQFEKTTGGMSKKGTYSYMAPEVYKGLPYGATVDVYSLGIVMYRFLNNNRGPFLPAFPAPIRYSDKEEATARRMRGDEMPMPCNADERLGQIIKLACAYDPAERFQSAAAMRRALESTAQPLLDVNAEPSMGGSEPTESTVLLGEELPQAGSTGGHRGYQYQETVLEQTQTEPKKEDGIRNNRKLIPILAACLVVVAFAVGFMITKGGDSNSETSAEQDPGNTNEEILISEDQLNKIKVLDSDWDWHNFESKQDSEDGLNHVNAILLVNNNSESAISKIVFSVESNNGGSVIMNDATGEDTFIAEGFVDSGESGIMVADIPKEKYSKKNPVNPQVSTYQVESASLSNYIEEGYIVPTGMIRSHDEGDYYSLRVRNENSVPVNKGAMAVLVRYGEDNPNVIEEAVANGTLKSEIEPDERAVEKKVFHNPGLQFAGATTEDYDAYILDLEYYHNGE